MGTIQIKRGQSANISSLQLLNGELALTLDTGELYGGVTSGKKLLNPEPPVKSVNGNTGVVTITDISGNSGSADKLKTSRQIQLSGAITGSANFDGTSNINITTNLNNIGDIDGGVF